MAVAPAPRPSLADPSATTVPSTTSPPTQPEPGASRTVPVTDAGTPSVLDCSGLRKRFGDRQAVDGVGFEIAPGETYGLLGPNGAGKTTTISMICGILRRDAGDVVVGRPFDPGATARKAEIGYVPQDLAIYPDLTAPREPALLRPALRACGGTALRRAGRRGARRSSSLTDRARRPDRAATRAG